MILIIPGYKNEIEFIKNKSILFDRNFFIDDERSMRANRA